MFRPELCSGIGSYHLATIPFKLAKASLASAVANIDPPQITVPVVTLLGFSTKSGVDTISYQDQEISIETEARDLICSAVTWSLCGNTPRAEPTRSHSLCSSTRATVKAVVGAVRC
ncbi:hypothetical protein INR49_006953 [Caranx melampygus]|nr:hypothetical protein INR49_006953 [Caranx melampygus]